jgi:uncharacterized protein
MKLYQIFFMARYMLHLQNNGYSPENSRNLVHKARELCSKINASIRVARVATNFVEFDIDVDEEKLDIVVETLSPIGRLVNARNIVEEEINKEDGLKEGIFYFNNERFWESHEALEGVWKKCSGKEKELVQGLILVAVAFAHSQKNDDEIGIGVLGRAIEKLDNAPEKYQNIDVYRICKKVKEMKKNNELTLFQI